MRTARSFSSGGYRFDDVCFLSMTPYSLPRYGASGDPRPVQIATVPVERRRLAGCIDGRVELEHKGRSPTQDLRCDNTAADVLWCVEGYGIVTIPDVSPPSALEGPIG